MSTSRFSLKRASVSVLATLALSTTHQAVHAGAWTGGATEWTQIGNMTLLGGQLGEQIAMVKKMADDYVLQYKKYEQLIMSGIKIEGISLADVIKLRNDWENFQAQLSQLGTDLKGLGHMFDKRLVEARLLRMPMEDYVRRESDKIKQGNQEAKARLARERSMMEQVNADIVRTDEFQSRIAGTAGQHQAMQLMNSQMNVLLQQMTRMVTLTAEAQGTDKAKALNEEAEVRELSKERNKALVEKDLAMRERDKASLDRMINYK